MYGEGVEQMRHASDVILTTPWSVPLRNAMQRADVKLTASADKPRQISGCACLVHDLIKELASSTQFHDQVEIASVFKCIMECERVGVLANTLHDGNLLDDMTASVTVSSFARQDLASILVIVCLHVA